jgi:DNA-binding MarR family transcriptional regulator
LSTQQFGVFLACYLCDEANTLRGLVQELDMPRLVVGRSLDKLVELDLIEREPDLRDTRNQILHQTEAGRRMLADLGTIASSVRLPSDAAD